MKEEKSRSITLRLFSTVSVIVLLLNVLSVIGTLSLSSLSRTNVIREHSYALELYMNQLDLELSQAQTRLYNLSHSFTYSIATAEEQSGRDDYEILRCQTELNTTLNEWLSQFPLIDGYYIRQPDTGLLILCGDDSQVLFQLEELLMQPGQPQITGEWSYETGETGIFLNFSAGYRNTVYGAWIQEERLLETWGIKNGSSSYRLLSNSEPAQNGSIDVASKQADCMLRYRLPAVETVLPAGVRILLIASLIMLAALPVVWFSIRKLVILPLRELMGAIRHIESGETDYRIPERSTSSEFGRLNMQFNNSLDQLAGMRLQVYESQLEKERIYVNYLSQQMQPHFVLNTLNLIFSMEQDEYDLIRSTVACLSDYYRYIAHVKDPMVPVSAELAHVENYFKLQQIRYPDMFFYSIDCPEDLKEAQIPPILIQTFAENAIKHSMKVGEVNRVEILVEHAEGGIHIRIRDYGSGYPQEVLDKIARFRETGEHQEGLGIGIQNTIERIHLIYQEKGRIQLANAEDGGAQIDLYIPETAEH